MQSGSYQNEEQVFMSAFIPQNLFEVVHIEKDISNLKRGNIDEIFYSALTGIDIAMKENEEQAEEAEQAEEDIENSGNSGNSDEEAEENGEASENEEVDEFEEEFKESREGESGSDVEYNDEEVRRVLEEHTVPIDATLTDGEVEAVEVVREMAYTLKNATKEEKKAHKQLVKEQKREKRKTKIPKSVKKRAQKQAKLRK